EHCKAQNPLVKTWFDPHGSNHGQQLIGGFGLDQKRGRPKSEEQTGQAPKEGEYQIFSEQLSNQSPAACTQRQTNCDFFIPSRRTGKQKVGEIDTGISITTPTSPISKARNPTTCPWGKRPGRRV